MTYNISKKTANTIVEELKTLLDTNFNFMDQTGYIIASVNKDRVGKLHSAAKIILDQGLEEFYVTKAMEDENTKEGLNLAIKVGGKIVGVVGITGQREDIGKFGAIVKRMTEIMLEESLRKEDKRMKRHIKYRFIEDWIYGRVGDNKDDFIQRGLGLGIDTRLKRRAISFKISNLSLLSLESSGQRMIDRIDEYIRKDLESYPSIMYLHLPSHYSIFLDANDKSYMDLVKDLCQKVMEIYGEALVFGIGGDNTGDNSPYDIYNQSIRAMEIADDIKENFVVYDDMLLENFLYDISSDRMKEYIERFSIKLDPRELDETINLIRVYFSKEGSISKMADSLFLHPNTIQYRLNKLQEQTGFDIRKPSETIHFHLFLMFYSFLNSRSS